MDPLKKFLFKHFEKIIVLSILIGIIFVNYFATYKIGFLNFFYLPIIFAGYFLGKRMAVLTAFFCILVVIIFIIISPTSFFTSDQINSAVFFSLLAWGSFLILTSAAIGYLYEERENKIKELRSAYIGILEILSKYLESADKYTQGHSVRVSNLSDDIARSLGLPSYERENIKTAALLHDIGKTEISLDIVRKAASLTSDEKELMDTHPEKGARLLSLVGGILSEAIPIVLAHHQYYFEADSISSEKTKNIPLGAKIIAVADSYDAMITDRPYRSGIEPWRAFEEIEKESGKRYLPEIVKALKEILLSDARYGKEEKGIS